MLIVVDFPGTCVVSCVTFHSVIICQHTFQKQFILKNPKFLKLILFFKHKPKNVNIITGK